MIKILITGPECSGKTTLALGIARYLKAPLVPEFARPYLSLRAGQYQKSDLSSMAAMQDELRKALVGLQSALVIHDTSWLVYKIWSQYKFQSVPENVERGFREMHFDLTLLCEPTDGYASDPLRENANSRWSLFYLYHKALFSLGRNYQVISGTEGDRLKQSISLIQGLH